MADPSGAGGVARLHINVINANDAPTWLSNPVVKPSVTRDQPYLAVSLAPNAADVDAGATLTFSKLSGPSWLSVAANGALSGTPSAGDAGANSFTVRVTDNIGASGDATLSIAVLAYQARSHHAFEDNTNDSLGNFPGTATGSPAYGTGRIGRGIVFDGVDDFVSLPEAAADYQDISVAAWVLWNGGAANQRVFDFGNNTSQYLFLSPNSGGLRFAIKGARPGQIAHVCQCVGLQVKSMKRIRTWPVFTSLVRTSGSVRVANWPHPGHSKSANSMTSIAAVGLPSTYPSPLSGGSDGSTATAFAPDFVD